MPWLSIAIALVTYLLMPKGTADERRRALLGAVAAGGATYAVSHYTDWGKENIGQFDGVIPEGAAPVANPAVPSPSPQVSIPGQTTTSGFWDTLKSWGPTGTATVVGVGAAAAGSTNWLLIGAIVAGAILLLK